MAAIQAVRQGVRKFVLVQCPGDEVEAWIESYAYAQPEQAHHLGELGYGLRETLQELGVPLNVANQGAARKLLLGKLPHASLVKKTVLAACQSLGAPITKDHEADAFVCANWGLSEWGKQCVGVAA